MLFEVAEFCKTLSNFPMKFRSFSFALGIVLASTAFVAPAKAVETQTCDDQVATIVSSDRIIYGTPEADVIVVEGEGRHKVLAGKGADIICGSDSKDRINGGAGADRIFGEGASDYLIGGTGRDMIMAGAGDDQVFGGPARDAINGEAGADTIDSGVGLNYCAGDETDILTGSCIIDQVAPAVYDVNIPATVDAGSTAVFSWKTSDVSSVYYTGGYLGGTNGWITEWCGFPVEPVLVAGDIFDGTYQAECAVPENAVDGTYSFFVISSDVVSQATYVSFDFQVTGGVADNAAPVLVSLDAPESLVEQDTFTLRYELTDESGVESVYAYIAGGNGFFADITTGLILVEPIDLPSNPITGDRFNGIWEQNFRMMDYAPSGTYTIWYGVVDIYGNRTFATGPSFTYVN
jgi:hypothetical protein